MLTFAKQKSQITDFYFGIFPFCKLQTSILQITDFYFANHFGVYASGTVIILIAFYYSYFLFKCTIFIYLPSSLSEVSQVVPLVVLQWWTQGEVNYL